jgi:hypothetical protein
MQATPVMVVVQELISLSLDSGPGCSPGLELIPMTPPGSPGGATSDDETGLTASEEMTIDESSRSDSSKKKPRLEPRHGRSKTTSESVHSAHSTPSTTPTTSPLLGPLNLSENTAKTRIDYWSLSVPELRQHLGVVGTDIAVGWEKAELVAVLQELDRIVTPELARSELRL